MNDNNKESYSKENETEQVQYNKKRSFFKFIAKVIIAIAILYVTGWDIISNVNFFEVALEVGKNPDPFIFGENGFAILINDSYYGLYIIDRFFYSPFIAWVGLGAAIGIIFF